MSIQVTTLIVSVLILLLNIIAMWQREHQRQAQKKLLEYKERQVKAKDGRDN